MLFLTSRTPGGGPSADGGATEGSPVLRTMAFAVPALMEKPVLRWILEFPGNGAHGAATDEFYGAPKPRQGCVFDSAGRRLWVQAGAPENFVGHPIAHTRESRLQQQHGLDGRLAVPLQKGAHELQSKGGGAQFRREVGPPIRRCRPLMEPHPSEEAGVAEHERARLLIQDEVIVFAGREVGPVDAQFAGHAKMKAEAGATGEAEQDRKSVV